MNPSVGALKRVLDGIPMSLAEFFAQDIATPRQAFYTAAELTEVGKGQISYRQIGADLAGRALQILIERYAPRSEEHTSELQSLMRNSYADFRLKKKTHPDRAITFTILDR